MELSVDFKDSKLHLSLRSPFARRVRIAFEECGIPYHEVVRDVWKPNPDFVEINPLHRVPTLELRSGHTIFESGLILELFYRSGDRPLGYRTQDECLKGLHWTGLAIGLLEKTIEWFLETLRPEKERDPEFIQDLPIILQRILPRLEREIGSRRFMAGDRLTQADVDLACTMAYLRFRYDNRVLDAFPQTLRYLEGLEARPAFKRTYPKG